MALTLMEASKIALGRDETYKATIMELYARNSEVLAALPFETISGNALTFDREKTLPNVGFRAVNEAYTESTGKVDKITETLAIAGGDIDVDKFLIKTGGMDQRAVQTSMKVKALALSITNKIIKGDVTSNTKSFDGLQVRCIGDQLIDAGSSSGGDALSLTKLDELIDAVENPTHLVMTKAMRRLLTAATRGSSSYSPIAGYITYTKDQFGNQVMMYGDLPILIVDKDNTNSLIMDFTEDNPGGGTAASQSIYCLSLMDNGVVGLQNSVMEVTDLGEIDTKPVYRTRVEWYITMTIMRERAAARLRGIKNSAVVA